MLLGEAEQELDKELEGARVSKRACVALSVPLAEADALALALGDGVSCEVKLAAQFRQVPLFDADGVRYDEALEKEGVTDNEEAIGTVLEWLNEWDLDEACELL